MPTSAASVQLAPPEPADPEATVTPKQLAYLAAIAESDGQLTTEAAAQASGTAVRTVARWRANNVRFRHAEQQVWRSVLLAAAPTALATCKRLLTADLDHGPKGLAEAGRMARWVLEGAGIVAGRGGPTQATQVTVNLAPLGEFAGASTTVDVPAWEPVAADDD